jgi:hypothetical protein
VLGEFVVIVFEEAGETFRQRQAAERIAQFDVIDQFPIYFTILNQFSMR